MVNLMLLAEGMGDEPSPTKALNDLRGQSLDRSKFAAFEAAAVAAPEALTKTGKVWAPKLSTPAAIEALPSKTNKCANVKASPISVATPIDFDPAVVPTVEEEPTSPRLHDNPFLQKDAQKRMSETPPWESRALPVLSPKHDPTGLLYDDKVHVLEALPSAVLTSARKSVIEPIVKEMANEMISSVIAKVEAKTNDATCRQASAEAVAAVDVGDAQERARLAGNLPPSVAEWSRVTPESPRPGVSSVQRPASGTDGTVPVARSHDKEPPQHHSAEWLLELSRGSADERRHVVDVSEPPPTRSGSGSGVGMPSPKPYNGSPHPTRRANSTVRFTFSKLLPFGTASRK